MWKWRVLGNHYYPQTPPSPPASSTGRLEHRQMVKHLTPSMRMRTLREEPGSPATWSSAACLWAVTLDALKALCLESPLRSAPPTP